MMFLSTDPMRSTDRRGGLTLGRYDPQSLPVAAAVPRSILENPGDIEGLFGEITVRRTFDVV